jgi:benzoyl-CoA reductase/2-hydroxyglutaryl-CoA dehydratase subunit BcrC/BadD/HgdB
MNPTCSPCTGQPSSDAFAHFARMIPNCLAYAREAKAQGRPIVGILCEFTPRELIMAAGIPDALGADVGRGAVPVCLCGGSAKTIPAAEQFLPTNLCPLIKSTFGYHVLKSNPFLEMADLIVAETTCDGKKKMYELMSDSRSMFVLELPQRADDSAGFDRWLAELARLKGHLEDHFHAPITAERLRAAISVMNHERHLRRQLASLMEAEQPPFTGRQLLDLRSSISGIPADFAQYEALHQRLSSASPPASNQKSVRVLLTGVPLVHGAERVLDLIESAGSNGSGGGAIVVAQESCSGLKPILEDVDASAADPLRAIGEKYYHLPCSVMTRNTRRLDSLRRLTAQYRPDCVIELIWQACLTYDVESHYVRRLAETELHVPYLRIETDYSPSDNARLTTRLEALYETVRQREPIPR